MRWSARGLAALIVLAGCTASASVAGDDGVRGTLIAETLVGTRRPSEQALRVQAVGQAQMTLSRNSSVHGMLRFESDASDRLEPGRPDPNNRSHATRRWLIDDDSLVELEELYVDARASDWSLRLGKQQIVWGTSDGIKVLDIVNPQSFREFILDAEERSRIALWTVSAVRPLHDRASLELIVIPDLSFHDVPEPGALFEITSPSLTPQASMQDIEVLDLLATRLAAGSPEVATLLQGLGDIAPPALQDALLELLAPRIEQRTRRPDWRPGNFEYGARVRGSFAGFEGALCVLRHYHDVPLVSVDFDRLDRATITRSYVRTTSIGAQLSHPAGPVLMRFEGVYGTRAPLPALDFPDDGLRARAPSYGGVIGADLPVRDAGLLSLQLGELGWRTDGDDYPVPERNSFATALWRDELVAGRLTGEVFSVISLQRGDLMLRARLLWQLRDDLLLQLGLDAFDGDEAGIFGQFDRRDRVGIELAWSI